MPHEIILIIMAILIWIFILRRFFQAYKKITGINVSSTVQNNDAKKVSLSINSCRFSYSSQNNHKESNVRFVIYYYYLKF